MDYLLENGGSVSAKDALGRTPLHVAAERHGKTKILQQLLVKGSDIDAKDGRDWTPLFAAVRAGNLPAALALLGAGADVSLRCEQRKILHRAARKGHVDILRAMIRHGVDVEAVLFGRGTALHIAVIHNKVAAIDVLAEAGANMQAPDSDGATPLHLAASYPSLEIVTTLLKHGARVNVRDRIGRTPLLRTALEAGIQGAAEEVVDMLLRSDAGKTLANDAGEIPADVIGDLVDEEDRLL